MGLFRTWLEASILGDREKELYLNKDNRDPYHTLQALYEEDNDLVVTYTNLNKVGINPKSTYATPLGIYFYPLYYVLKMNLNVPSFHGAPFINVCKIKNPERVPEMEPVEGDSDWEHPDDPKNEQKDYKKAISLIIKYTGYPKEILHDIRNKYDIRSNYSLVWLVTKELSGDGDSNPVQWNKLLRELGYDGFIDHGTGTIHENEPTQGVVFSGNALKTVMTIKNSQLPNKYKFSYNNINRQKIDKLIELLDILLNPNAIDGIMYKFDIDRAKTMINILKQILSIDDKDWRVRKAIAVIVKDHLYEFRQNYGTELSRLKGEMHDIWAEIYMYIVRMLLNKYESNIETQGDEFSSFRGSRKDYEDIYLDKIGKIIEKASQLPQESELQLRLNFANKQKQNRYGGY